MNTRFFLIFFSIIFISFIPKRFNSNGYEKYKNIADSIFISQQNLDSFAFQTIYGNSFESQPRVAVIIGHIFTNDKKNAIVIYTTSDSTLSLDLFQIQNSKWHLAHQQSVECRGTGPADKFVYFEELNDDKIKELLILTNVWEVRTSVNLKAFLYKKNKLTEIKGFDNYPNPEYDPKTKKVYAYMGTSCADMAMDFLSGSIQGDSLVTIDDIGCDCCSENLDSCEIAKNNNKSFKVKYEDCYKYVQPYYQDFLKCKLKQIKDDKN